VITQFLTVIFIFKCYRWLRVVETVGRQYAFIKFDRVIQKKRRDYSDPNSSGNMKKLNDDLQNIQDIMRKTIDDVLDRGNKLDGMTYLYLMSF
jgi:vesicle transport protein SEC22